MNLLLIYHEVIINCCDHCSIKKRSILSTLGNVNSSTHLFLLFLDSVWTYSVIDFVVHCVLGYLSFKFAILVAAFKSRSSGHSIYYTEPITCPTLHVFGDTDRVIPKGMYSAGGYFKVTLKFVSFTCTFVQVSSSHLS